MSVQYLDNLAKELREVPYFKPVGTVVATQGGQLVISGLEGMAKLGDVVSIDHPDTGKLGGEVVQIDGASLRVMPDGDLTGLKIGAQVVLQGPLRIAPCDAWLGRVIGPQGQPIDGTPLMKGLRSEKPRRAPLQASQRRGFGARLATGANALNTVLPIVRGQRVGLFAGSGVGKSSLLGTLVQNLDCDVAVVALVGERGRELRHFVQQVLAPEHLKKCVVVAATSDQSALQRRRCAWTAMTVAEHFRDQGKSVLYVADSITRFAEAHREVAAAGGELPVLRGYPPSTAHYITELCERAGPGTEGTGDITAVFSVLVQGSDMEEPIADILRGVLDGHIVLNREIAERGRYPAIDLLKSVSRSLPGAASVEENDIILKTRHAISLYEQNALMIRSGLYNAGADPELDMAVKLWPELDAFLGQCDVMQPEDSFDRLRLIFRRAGAR